jgi:hypothetical protein
MFALDEISYLLTFFFFKSPKMKFAFGDVYRNCGKTCYLSGGFYLRVIRNVKLSLFLFFSHSFLKARCETIT